LKKILIIGASGFVGNYCFKKLKSSSRYSVIGTTYKTLSDNLIPIDYTNSNDLVYLLKKIDPDIIIWSAGVKNIDKLENDYKVAYKNNIQPIENIANFISDSKKEIKLIFISSDYVFNGEKGNYKVNDYTSPNTNYGRSKLDAENIIRKLKTFTIIRVAAILGGRSVFLNWILEEIKNNNRIHLYDDIFSPTPINNVFLAIQKCIDEKLTGIYHLSGNKNISRYQFGVEIKKFMPDSKADLIKKYRNYPHIIDRSLITSTEFSDFKSLEIKTLLSQ